ncbi:MAG: hypothetical protein V4557_15890 [Bacteroidota bacterium]
MEKKNFADGKTVIQIIACLIIRQAIHSLNRRFLELESDKIIEAMPWLAQLKD